MTTLSPHGTVGRVFLVGVCLLAFAGNSLLCRAALRNGDIDAASFTTLRLLAGAVVLVGLSAIARRRVAGSGNWISAFALFVYAAGFSWAYLSLSAGTGALLLFAAVQATMIGVAIFRGERLRAWQWIGLALALAGLVWLLWPGLAAPAPTGAALMLAAGIAWGVYTLRGRGAGDALRVTAGNFVRALPFVVVLSLATWTQARIGPFGVACALVSGALASGVGYALWYTVLPALRATTAATLQLAVPVIAAALGVLLLAEAPTWRLGVAAGMVLGGIALVLRTGSPSRLTSPPSDAGTGIR